MSIAMTNNQAYLEKPLLNILVIDIYGTLAEFADILKSLSIQIFITKDFALCQSIIDEYNLSCIFFPCLDEAELSYLFRTVNNIDLTKIIVIVNDKTLGQHLISIGIGNYLLNTFLSNKDLIEQMIENTIRIQTLSNNVKKTNLIYEKQLEKITSDFHYFTYIISHDLRAPLRAISNISEWIQEDLDDTISSETKENIKLLRGRVKRLDALIDGILQYSRIDRIKLILQLVDVNQLLKELTDFMLDKPTEFSIYIQSPMPIINTYKEKLEQVFFHLLKNTIQFRSKDDGFAKVSVVEEIEFYHFTIKDNGIGIAPEYHKKVFEIFHTLSARDKVESVGIGLTLVKKIVESVGGKVNLESNLDQGSSFHFWWPKLLE